MITKLLSSPGFHKWATLAWILVGVPVTCLYPQSVLWVAAMSLYANVIGHWSAYQAAMAEKAVNDK